MQHRAGPSTQYLYILDRWKYRVQHAAWAGVGSPAPPFCCYYL